jgi:acyl dehydratase
METKLYWEDVQEGEAIPTFARTSELLTWSRYAGATGDFYGIHLDPAVARATGQPDVFGPASLRFAYVHCMLRAWIGEAGWVHQVECQYRGMNFKGDVLTCHGKVTRKYVEDDQHFIDLEVSVLNQKGEETTPGTATVILPSRISPMLRVWE